MSAVLNQIKKLKLLEQNIPSSIDAYNEASSLGETNPLDFKWSHPLIYHAGAKVGWYRLKTESEYDIKKEFLEIYEQILEESEFKESLLLLPEFKEEISVEKPLSKGKLKARLENIKKKYL